LIEFAPPRQLNRYTSPMTPDPLRYYDLESYLTNEVHRRFELDHSLNAFDFFSIVVWKANRAKSRIAQRLRKVDSKRRKRLDPIVRDLTRSLYEALDARSRLAILIVEWGFMLPMASAILSILWPDEFTVYDVRVCGELNAFSELAHASNFDIIWAGYCKYRDAVRTAVPLQMSLRDKDRYLWTRSMIRQLNADIAAGFVRNGDV
jgi:hypothetical protein